MAILRGLELAAAGLCGMAGVAAAAAAAHAAASPAMGSVALVSLAHAPVLVALALFGTMERLLALAGVLLALGTLLFATDMGWRELIGAGLFPFAAPLAGMTMIVGWLCILAAGATSLWQSRRRLP